MNNQSMIRLQNAVMERLKAQSEKAAGLYDALSTDDRFQGLQADHIALALMWLVKEGLIAWNRDDKCWRVKPTNGS